VSEHARLRELEERESVTTTYKTEMGLQVWRRDQFNHSGTLREVNLAFEEPGKYEGPDGEKHYLRNWSGFVRVQATDQGLYQAPYGPAVTYNGTSANRPKVIRQIALLMLEGTRLIEDGEVV